MPKRKRQNLSRLLLSVGSLLVIASLGGTSYAAIPPCGDVRDVKEITITAYNKINYTYEYHSCFREGLAIVGSNNKYGYVNIKGELVIPLQYSSATTFKDGVASVSISVIEDDQSSILSWKTVKKYGLIDTQGNWIIAPMFDAAPKFIRQ